MKQKVQTILNPVGVILFYVRTHSLVDRQFETHNKKKFPVRLKNTGMQAIQPMFSLNISWINIYWLHVQSIVSGKVMKIKNDSWQPFSVFEGIIITIFLLFPRFLLFFFIIMTINYHQIAQAFTANTGMF